MLVQPPGVPDETAPAGPLPARRRHPELELRFVDQRMFGGLAVSDGRCGPAAGDRAHRPRPARPGVRRRRVRPPRAAQRSRASSGSCSTRASSPASATSTPTRGCGWPGCTASGSASKLRASDVRRVLAGCREVMLAALGQGGTSFDALYVNVNGQSGYFDRSLRGLRPRGRALLPLRYADPADHLHEPLVVLLPGLPAGARRRAARRPQRAASRLERSTST